MNPRALSLIAQLDLQAHPEGGFFREVFRSSSLVTAKSTGAHRTAITSIYYLLPTGQVSKFHRVTSDEVWHFLEGDPLELYTLDPGLTALQTHTLGPVAKPTQPIFTVPANHWQAAMPKGTFALVGCTMGPGFEYEDFALLAEETTVRDAVRRRFPNLADLI